MPQYKSIQQQQHIWSNVINNYTSPNDTPAYEWGNPDDEMARNLPQQVLGNYKKIKDEYLLPNITNKIALEIGSFDGKWTEYMHTAGRIICVDIIDNGFPIIEEKIPNTPLLCIKNNGYDFPGVDNESVDFIFSMDSLVRSEKEIIEAYIKEVYRVIKPTGKACIHLPCQTQHLSWELGFTQINEDDIARMCFDAGFTSFRIDKETINHGAVLLIGYGEISEISHLKSTT